MRRMIFLFVFALITSTAAFAVAADKNVDKSAGHAEFKAELSKAEVPGMKAPDTMATGEATFEFSGPGIRGKAAGGAVDSESRRVQEGVPGAGAVDGRGTGGAGSEDLGESYEGIIDKSMAESEGSGGAAPGGVEGSGVAETTKPAKDPMYYGGILKDKKSTSGGSAAGGGAPKSDSAIYYKGIIDRVSSGAESAGAGGATRDVLRYKLNVKDIENVTAAHLHLGKQGTAEGPVIAPLYTGPRKAGEFSGMLSQGTITDKDLKGPLSGKSVADLAKLMSEGNVYVNVHTSQNPAGEIRGEVTPK